jgi:hypothetical protein
VRDEETNYDYHDPSGGGGRGKRKEEKKACERVVNSIAKNQKILQLLNFPLSARSSF